MPKKMTFEEWLACIIKKKSINISELARKTEIPYQLLYDSLFNKKKKETEAFAQSEDPFEAIKKLAELKDMGIISQEELKEVSLTIMVNIVLL